MSALIARLRRLVVAPATPIPMCRPTPDHIGELLHAAIDADAHAKARNVETYAARVEEMIDDFFAKYGGKDGKPHP